MLMEEVCGRPWISSASSGCVQLPRVQTSIIGQWSFAFHGPTVWIPHLPHLPCATANSHWTRLSGAPTGAAGALVHDFGSDVNKDLRHIDQDQNGKDGLTENAGPENGGPK